MSTNPGSSETFPNRGTPPLAANGQPTDAPARRTMAEITSLFLSGANPFRPQRIAPQNRTPPPLPSAPAKITPPPPTRNPSPIQHSAFSIHHSPSLPPVQIVLLQPTPASQDILLDAAKRLAAQHHCALGLITSDDTTLSLTRIDAAPTPRFTSATFAHPQSPVDVQVARALYSLRGSVDTWLIALPHLDEPSQRQLLEAAPDWLLFTGTENDHLLDAYRTLKSVCITTDPSNPHHIRLLVRTTDRAAATRTHARLHQVAQGFLDQELELLTLPHVASAAVTPIAHFDLPDPPSPLWLSVIDFATELSHPAELEDEAEPPAPEHHPQPTQPRHQQSSRTPHPLSAAAPELTIHDVVDEDERAALSAILEDSPKPKTTPSISAPTPAPVAAIPPAAAPPTPTPPPTARPTPHPENPPIPIPAQSTPALIPPVSSPLSPQSSVLRTPSPFQHSDLSIQHSPLPQPTLRVVDAPLQLTRPALWKIAQQSLAGLLAQMTILPARPPFHDAVLLAVDSPGRLHMFILADAASLTLADALTQWANAHHSLIALTQPNLKMNPKSPVITHLILPPDPRPLISVSGENSNIYRLEPITWGPRHGLMVIPQ